MANSELKKTKQPNNRLDSHCYSGPQILLIVLINCLREK